MGLEDSLEKEMATRSSILPGKSCGQRSLVAYNPWGRKESDTTKRLNCHFSMQVNNVNNRGNQGRGGNTETFSVL